MRMRHLVTWCPYDDQYPIDVTLDDDQPTKFGGECMHAAVANLVLENGDDLRTQMPTLATHVETAQRARAGAAEVDGAAPRLPPRRDVPELRGGPGPHAL